MTRLSELDLYAPRILILDDTEDDGIVINHILRETGVDIQSKIVLEFDALVDAISAFMPNLLISDYNLREYTALDVAQLLEERNNAIPLIVVSNSIGEKAAVEVMKAGARDVVDKRDHKHLVAAVSMELLALDRAQQKEKYENKIESINRDKKTLKGMLDRLTESEKKSSTLFTQLNNVFDSSPDGICVIDTKCNVLRANDKYWSYLNSPPFNKCFMGPDCPGETHISCSLKKFRDGHTGHIQRELRVRYDDGSQKHFLRTSTPLLDKNGKLEGIVQYLRDMTDWKAMQRQMAQSQKMESIGQLAAGIAHEINTPAQFVGDNVNFLEDAFGDLMATLEACAPLRDAARKIESMKALSDQMDEKFEQADMAFLTEEVPSSIAQAKEGINRISKIVREMKNFSHPGSEEAKPFDPNACIQSTVLVSTNEWKYVSRVDMKLAPDLPRVNGYPDEFKQVVLNMVVNAAHAIETRKEAESIQGIIRIQTSRELDHVIVKISDNGLGIPESIRQKVFNPFFTTKTEGKGTGQGLALAHKYIVDKHGGQIDIDSQEGEGTTFIIRLPIQDTTGSKEVFL